MTRARRLAAVDAAVPRPAGVHDRARQRVRAAVCRGRRRGRARTSLAMWSNFLRFVGDGIAVGELPAAAGQPKPRPLSMLGGMERWRYVFVGPTRAKSPPKTKLRRIRKCARAFRSDWVVRVTPAGLDRLGRSGAPLPGDIEERWRERFGPDAIGRAQGIAGVRSPVGSTASSPIYLPILGSS